MKTARFLFVMTFAAVLLPRTSHAAQANSAPEQATSQSTEKSANDQQKDEVRNESVGKGQTRSGEPGHNQKRPARQTRSTARLRSSVNSPKAAPRDRARPDKTAANNLGTHVTRRTTGLQQTSSKAATAISGKAVGHRSPPIPPPAVSVNGQHFRNSRDPGARLAVSGGPLMATRGTAAINGSDVKRKP